MGEVKSTATMRLDPDGTVTPSTSIQINGLQIGGLPVGLTPQGLGAAGSTVPLPLNSTLASILVSSHVTMAVVQPQQFPDKVLSPALQITAPVQVPDVGPGTLTIVVGEAAASLQAGQAAEAAAASAAPTTGTGEETPAVGGSVDTSGAALPAPAGALSSQPPGLASTPSAPRSTGRPSSAAAPRVALGTAASAAFDFDIRNVYLTVAAGALGGLLLGQLIRLLGVRGPWKTSSAG
jgi:hypothetical protein